MCVFVSALTRFVQVYNDKHPLKPKAVPTDYTIGMVLLPTVMIGSSAGVMGHVVIPDVITTIMLEMLLLYTAYKTFLNGRKTMAKENAARIEAKRKQEEELSKEEEAQASLLGGDNKINLSDKITNPSQVIPKTVENGEERDMTADEYE